MPGQEILEVKHKDGTTAFKCRENEGIKVPPRMQDPEKRIQELRELKYKEGDIFIASYPKVGTNWLKDSLGMLLKGKPELSFMVATMLDFYPSLEDYKNKDSGRVAITHLRPAHLSEDQKAKAKFILVIRNPKDAAVSMYYHLLKERTIELKGSWDQFFDLLVQGQVIYGTFFDYYRDWQKFVKSHEKQVLIVHYEDMHKDYQKQLRRIAGFVGLNISDEVIKQIAEKGKMKTVHDELIKDPKVQAMAKIMTTDGSLPFYRKGEVGDWKNHFTVAQSELFDQIIEKEMKDSMFELDYVL